MNRKNQPKQKPKSKPAPKKAPARKQPAQNLQGLRNRLAQVERKLVEEKKEVSKLKRKQVSVRSSFKLSPASERALQQMLYPEKFIDNPVPFPGGDSADRVVWSKRTSITLTSTATGTLTFFIRGDPYQFGDRYADNVGTPDATATIINNESGTLNTNYVSGRCIACCVNVRPTAALTALSGEFTVVPVRNLTNEIGFTTSLAAAQAYRNAQRVSGQARFHAVPYPQDLATFSPWAIMNAARSSPTTWGVYICSTGLPANTGYSIDLVHICEAIPRIASIPSIRVTKAADSEAILPTRSSLKSVVYGVSSVQNLPQSFVMGAK
jgi:hypothetical protein